MPEGCKIARIKIYWREVLDSPKVDSFLLPLLWPSDFQRQPMQQRLILVPGFSGISVPQRSGGWAWWGSSLEGDHPSSFMWSWTSGLPPQSPGRLYLLRFSLGGQSFTAWLYGGHFYLWAHEGHFKPPHHRPSEFRTNRIVDELQLW